MTHMFNGRVILRWELTGALLDTLGRLTVQKLTAAKREIVANFDWLIDQVGRLEKDGWNIAYGYNDVRADHSDLKTKEEMEKRLEELGFSFYDCVYVKEEPTTRPLVSE